MESKTTDVVQCYADALKAEKYRLQFKNRDTEEGFWVDYTAAQLVKLETVKYLSLKNKNGFDVYARPVGWQFVLLDDLTQDVLADLADLKPCMLMETSPGNFQAWLTLPEIPADRDTAKASCKELAIRFGADLASAEPDHVGRLPGFTNRKPKHQKSNGHFPYVLLRRWEYRLSTFYPRGGPVFNNTATQPGTCPTYRHSPGKGSISEQDFGVACGLVKAGKIDEQIYDHLLRTSPDLESRKGRHIDRYLRRTISNARKSVG